MVKFLLEHLDKSGCAVGDGFIKAVHCDKEFGGGYTRGEGVLYFMFILNALNWNWNVLDGYKCYKIHLIAGIKQIPLVYNASGVVHSASELRCEVELEWSFGKL